MLRSYSSKICYFIPSFFRYSAKVFVKNLPATWNVEKMKEVFSAAGEVESVNIINNKMGQSTGKEYSQEASVDDAMKLFNYKAIENKVCQIRPFRDKLERLRRRLKLYNLSYKTTREDLEIWFQEFAEVEEIIIPFDSLGNPKGYAFVYLKDIRAIPKVLKYLDGRHIKNRKIKIELYTGKKARGY